MVNPNRAIDIEFSNVTKKFGPLIAIDSISLKIHSGEIHALVGENGAGKSTLMKMLFGLLTCDSGEIYFRGQRLNIKGPSDARKNGIGMVHQHFMLAGAMTALDHLLLESPLPLLSFLPRTQLRQNLQKFAQDLGLPLNWDLSVDELPVGLQQRLEILKLLYFKNDILILDEPTAVLAPQETQDFLERLRHLRDLGKTIILITHKLKEVFAVADQVSILRHGKLVASKPMKSWTLQSMAEQMVGEKTKSAQYAERSLDLKNRQALSFQSGEISLKLGVGEILGIAGVEGNGQNQLIESLINPSHGESNSKIRRSGVGYLSEDRHLKSITLSASVLENFLLGIQDLFTRWGFVDWSRLTKNLEIAKNDYNIRWPSISAPIAHLSGGNQQKLVVARELQRKLHLLIAAQPTRGVDLGAIEHIHEAFLKIRQEGTSVVLVSSELDELMKLSDRIVVLCKHRVVAEFERSEFDEKKIGAAMGGAR